MKLKIIEKYDVGLRNDKGTYRCRDEQGFAHRVDILCGHDLLRDSDFEVREDLDPQSLVGLEIECSGLAPYLEIAMDPKLPDHVLTPKKTEAA